MRKLIPLAGAVILAAATPAAAQYDYDRPGYVQQDSYGYQMRLDRLAERFDTAVRGGRVPVSQQRRIRAELRNLRLLDRQHAAGGYGESERQELQDRIRGLQRMIADALRNSPYGDAYSDYRDARDPDYDRNWDQRGDDYRSDDYWEDERDDRGSTYPYDRGYGDDRGYGAYGVGDRLPDAWMNYGVPMQYRYRYPDNAYYSYRYDGRFIYEVDRRTGRITRIIDAR